jgi:EAL domain-containing protein (putative c-di-GMP-specific phosphodiesterase class I)
MIQQGMDLLSVEFQPIVDLRSGDIFGYEALGRGPAPPAVLLDEAARDGWLLSLDWSWRRAAIRAVAERHAHEDTRFFLNVDTRILDDPEFAPGDTLALLGHYGLPPERFVLELSERGAALASDRFQALVEHFRAQGFHIALDDVGAGYSSLNTVVQARPHVLKLDMELVRGVGHDRLRLELVRAFAEFSRRAGIALIAEGVEVADDLAALASAGVHLGQGWLLGRPQASATIPRVDVRALAT